MSGDFRSKFEKMKFENEIEKIKKKNFFFYSGKYLY